MSEVITRFSPTNGGNKVAAMTENSTENVGSQTPQKPTNLSIVAFLVTILFNHIFGLFAMYFTVSAKHSWECHDNTKSKRHSRYAVVLIVLGIIFGLATYAIAFPLYFTLKEEASCTPSANVSQNTATVTAQCCQHCVALSSGDLCSLYCESSGQVPIIPDQTVQYADCCGDLGCTQPPAT